MSDCKHDLPKKMCADCHASDLEAEVADLKARLKAVGKAHVHVMWVGVPEELMRQATRATDLRRKNWRKP